MRFIVPRRYWGLHPTMLAHWLLHNRENLGNETHYQEVSDVPDVLRKDCAAWCDGRDYAVWWYDSPNETRLEVDFTDNQDGLMFKLTWGGR